MRLWGEGVRRGVRVAVRVGSIAGRRLRVVWGFWGTREMKLNQRRLRYLLTTASAAAMIVGLTAEANAACSVVPAGGLSNSTTIDCIDVTSTVTGNIVNVPPGTIRNQFGATPTYTTHAILVVSTLSGSIQNTGTILANAPGATGSRNAIIAKGASVITEGITNNGIVKAAGSTSVAGMLIGSASFAGGIANQSVGFISAVSERTAAGPINALAAGICLNGATFNGGIINAGTINAFAKL